MSNYANNNWMSATPAIDTLSLCELTLLALIMLAATGKRPGRFSALPPTGWPVSMNRSTANCVMGPEHLMLV